MILLPIWNKLRMVIIFLPVVGKFVQFRKASQVFYKIACALLGFLLGSFSVGETGWPPKVGILYKSRIAPKLHIPFWTLILGGSDVEKQGGNFFVNNTVEALIQGLIRLQVPLREKFQCWKKMELSPKEGLSLEGFWCIPKKRKGSIVNCGKVSYAGRLVKTCGTIHKWETWKNCWIH